MSTTYPRIRLRTESGYLLIREGLTVTFYIRCSHQEISQYISRSLESYLHAIGPTSLGLYADEEGDWQLLDEAGWAVIRNELNDPHSAYVHLTDASSPAQGYHFIYQGRCLDAPFLVNEPGATSAVSFWLPSEFLEEHGPGRVRELAMALATPLPFCTGYAGLSFNGATNLAQMRGDAPNLRFRYPGMDVPDMSWVSLHIGTQVRGPSWLTFLGQPVLGELGGVSGLRARLRHPETTVHEMEGDRAVVALGPWPEAGDTEQGNILPAYRELARVLEPWLYHEPRLHPHPSMEDTRRWERRFLD